MPFRFKSRPSETSVAKNIEAVIPGVTLFRRWLALLTDGLTVIIVVSILNASCVPVFSSRKPVVVPSQQDGVSGGLIKPKLQDQEPTNSAQPMYHKDKVNPSDQIKQTAANRSWGLWNRLFGSSPGNKTFSSNSNLSLIKPKLSENPETGADTGKQLGGVTQIVPTREEVRTPAATSQSAESLNGSPDPKEAETGTSGKTPTGKESDGAKAVLESREATANTNENDPARKKDKERDISQSDDQKVQTNFKKHDHAKYVSMIRNKAIDTLNKEPSCDIARLCRDSFTDNWSLILYAKSGKYYSYSVYTWDEIDGSWVASYTSEKRPVASMKKHVGFSSAGKTCQTLKGSEHVEPF